MMTDDLFNAAEFILAGHAVFTLTNEKTGRRFTYRVRECSNNPGKIWFVDVLTGPDNTHDYSFIGTLSKYPAQRRAYPQDGNPFFTFKHSHRAQVVRSARSVLTFQWLIPLFTGTPLPASVTIEHAGLCGRCGRTLTTPESIRSGFGPVCIEKMRGAA